MERTHLPLHASSYEKQLRTAIEMAELNGFQHTAEALRALLDRHRKDYENVRLIAAAS